MARAVWAQKWPKIRSLIQPSPDSDGDNRIQVPMISRLPLSLSLALSRSLEWNEEVALILELPRSIISAADLRLVSI